MTGAGDLVDSRPRVTVIMPVYNAEAYVGCALRSLQNQTLKDFELIVVDDGSTDDTAHIVSEFDDPRITLLRLETNGGGAAARNHALKKARAPLVAQFDADDVAWPQRLEAQAAFLDRHPDVDVVGSQIRVIDNSGGVVGRRSYPQSTAAIMRAMPRYNPMAHPTVMIRTGVLVDAAGYDERVSAAQDYALWSKLARRGAVFVNLPATLVDYRVHKSATKRMRLRESLRNTLMIQQQYWADAQSPLDRLYRRAEGLLLRLPEGLVNTTFVFTRYHLPTATAALRARLSPRRRPSSRARRAS